MTGYEHLWALACVVCCLLGYALRAGTHRCTQPDREDIRAYLDAQLGLEELEIADRRMRAQMLKAGRTSVPHPNAGAPARISSIHVVRSVQGSRRSERPESKEK